MHTGVAKDPQLVQTEVRSWPAWQQVPKEELVMRFNTALQELQLLGMIRESSRRRRDHSVQRLIFHMRAF